MMLNKILIQCFSFDVTTKSQETCFVLFNNFSFGFTKIHARQLAGLNGCQVKGRKPGNSEVYLCGLSPIPSKEFICEKIKVCCK